MDPVKFLASLAVPLLFLDSSKNKGSVLVIKHGETELFRDQIKKEDKKIYKIKLPVGYTAEIVVSDGKVWLKRMPNWVCPKHICSDTGKVGLNSDKKIVCMPNKLMIYFE